MDKILVIDNGDSSVHKFKKALSRKRFALQSAKTIQKALSCLKDEGVNLIVIDSSHIDQPGRLGQVTSDIPKIILIREGRTKSNGPWLKQNNTLPVYEPASFNEFWHIASQLIRTKILEGENKSFRSIIKINKRKLDFFDSITDSLTGTSSLKECLNGLMEKARAATSAQAWSILIPQSDPVFKFLSLRNSKRIQRIAFKDGAGVAGCTIDNGQPLIINDVTKDRRFSRSIDKFSDHKIISMICAPLIIKGRAAGVMRLINKKDGTDFMDHDLKALVKASELAGVAVERTYMNFRIKNDDLTNLYNVRYLHQAIEMEIERSRRYETCFSVIFMDLDNFKKVNDRFGHLTGSRILIEIAGLLQDNLRKIDVITRYGGDEFVIIMPQTCIKSAFMVAERLRKSVEKRAFHKESGHSIRLTASFGVAAYPDNAGTKDELIKMADKAMYHGKFSTKNIVYAAKT